MDNKIRVTKRQIYFWNLAGSLCNAVTSMILLMIVTRTTDNYYADMFSYSFALSQLLVTIGLFQVRNYQATDVREKYEFTDYFTFRIITCFIMMIFAFLYIQFKGYTLDKKIVILFVCLYKSIEAMSDVFQGLFQQKGRLDLAGKSLTLKAVFSSFIFAVGMYITNNLILSCSLLFISSCLCFALYDLRKYREFSQLNHVIQHIKKYYKRLYGIFGQCFPLFINGFLIMAIYNAPKNAIDLCTEQNILPQGIQTDYNIIFMPASVINLFLIFLRPFMTEMAYALSQNRKDRFYKMLFKIIGGLFLFGILSIIGAYLLGIPILEVIYSRHLTKYKTELIMLMIAGGMSSLATAIDNIITVIRIQHVLVISYFLSWIVARLIAYPLIEKYALYGAVVVFMVTMLILLICNLLILLFGLKRHKDKRTGCD